MKKPEPLARDFLRPYAVLFMTILLSACYDRSVSEPKSGSPASDSRVPSVYLVSVNRQSSDKEISTLFARYGVSGVKRVDLRLYQVTLAKDPGLQYLQKLATESDVIGHIQPNNIYRKH